VDATLRSLAGTRIWLPPNAKPGQITQLQGTPVSIGGPLDHAGFWAQDPHDPTAGWIPFAVEVKNIRGWIYPWDPEIWDLLAKVASFPDVVPVLVARKMHYISFRMLKDLGGLGTQTGKQLFADRGTTRASIDPDRFAEVTSGLSLRDCKLVDPTSPSSRLQKFFGETAYKLIDGASLAVNSQARWQATAPIVAQFAELRDDTLPMSRRTDLWKAFGREVERAGLMGEGGWVTA